MGRTVFDPLSAARVCYAAVRQFRREHGYLCPEWDALGDRERGWWADWAGRAHAGYLPREIHEAWLGGLDLPLPGPSTEAPLMVPWEELDAQGRAQFTLIQMTVAGLSVVFTDGLAGSPVTAL
jgi:hypothetical protein